MTDPQHHESAGGVVAWLPLIPLGAAAVAYLAAAAAENGAGGRGWPASRCVLWLLGLGVIGAALIGPLVLPASASALTHMAAHLLVGMLAPLLLVLSAPVTLALRTLDVVPARRLSRLFAARPARFLTHPAPAAVINVGSLWVLYATPIAGYVATATAGSALLHQLLLAHFLAAGYLFTVSIVGVDPAPHRAGFSLRLVVLGFAVAAHSIIAKRLYGQPPAGTLAEQAQDAALLMYYGGAGLELALVTVFCSQWYRASGRAIAPRSDRTRRR